jgi:hypothetical protein
MDARAANDRIAEKARQLHFLSRVPMMCECSKPSCRQLVMVSLGEYREIREDYNTFLAAPSHDAEEAELVREACGFDIRRGGYRRHDGDGDRRSA